jgi:hypothetical protein
MRIGGWLAFPLAAITIAVAVGCGSVETRSSEAPAQDPSSSVSSTDTLGSAETTDAAPTDTGDGSDSVPAVEEMSVFSRPRTEADVLPGGLGLPYGMDCPDIPEWRRHGGCSGEALGDESRLLLSGLGVRDTSLYAWPTLNGWVCWAWVGEGGGGCLHDFTQAEMRVAYAGIDPDQPGSGYPGTLIGVVPDDVVAAQIQVDGVAQPAIVQSNGIFYELPDGSCTNWAFESLTATYRDGSSNTVPIRWHDGPGNTPAPCPS